MPRIGRSIQTKLISGWHLGERRIGSECLMGMGFPFGSDENVVQHCEYTKPLNCIF